MTSIEAVSYQNKETEATARDNFSCWRHRLISKLDIAGLIQDNKPLKNSEIASCNFSVDKDFHKISHGIFSTILKHNEKHNPLFRNIGIVITIPMVFAAGPVLGFLIGYWVDERFQTDPWGKTILSLLGFVASVRQVIQLIKTATKNSDS